ncbi:MAG: hypothetical protein M1840_007229 [Geoglossum simile]|nr:MAG: hypothetical protein M1840_007229 [Geoglossum simile]
MLYEFHHQQSSKHPGSIHATYLLTGVRRSPEAVVTANADGLGVGQNDYMQSSPFMGSSMPTSDVTTESLTKSVMLVREDELDSAKALFVGTVSIHIYSLEPSSIKNLQILEDSNREILAKYVNEDPLEVGRTYGTIQNPFVRRRSRQPGPYTLGSSAAPRIVGTRSDTKIERTQSIAGSRKNGPTKETEPTPAKSTMIGNDEIKQGKVSAKKPVSLKRGQSDIFKSFAKSKPKLQKEDTESSVAASSISAVESSEFEDEPMKDASEEEQEEDFIIATDPKKSTGKSGGRKSIAERQARLREMMEDDDEPMEDSGDVKMEDTEDNKETEASRQSEVAEPPPVVSTGGRRRGRRKVMKKKTVKDEEGYLVTREEPAWESFSEAEPEPSKSKTATPTAPPIGPNKSKKSAGKPGQGNIMTFFAKK